jgi:hypothetical protein
MPFGFGKGDDKKAEDETRTFFSTDYPNFARVVYEKLSELVTSWKSDGNDGNFDDYETYLKRPTETKNKLNNIYKLYQEINAKYIKIKDTFAKVTAEYGLQGFEILEDEDKYSSELEQNTERVEGYFETFILPKIKYLRYEIYKKCQLLTNSDIPKENKPVLLEIIRNPPLKPTLSPTSILKWELIVEKINEINEIFDTLKTNCENTEKYNETLFTLLETIRGNLETIRGNLEKINNLLDEMSFEKEKKEKIKKECSLLIKTLHELYEVKRPRADLPETNIFLTNNKYICSKIKSKPIFSEKKIFLKKIHELLKELEFEYEIKTFTDIKIKKEISALEKVNIGIFIKAFTNIVESDITLDPENNVKLINELEEVVYKELDLDLDTTIKSIQSEHTKSELKNKVKNKVENIIKTCFTLLFQMKKLKLVQEKLKLVQEKKNLRNALFLLCKHEFNSLKQYIKDFCEYLFYNFRFSNGLGVERLFKNVETAGGGKRKTNKKKRVNNKKSMIKFKRNSNRKSKRNFQRKRKSKRVNRKM